MGKTYHHGKDNHLGEDYGSKHKCNKLYNQAYGKYGRARLHEELRNEDKKMIRKYLDEDDE
jgi:hypothetical protein